MPLQQRPASRAVTVTLTPVSARRGIQWQGRADWWSVEAHEGTSKRPGASRIGATFLTKKAAAKQAAVWLERGWA